jgi:hypothetical protein
MSVNSVLDGVVFTGIREAELFPVICNYGSSGEAMLVSIERGGAAVAATVAAQPTSGPRLDPVGGVLRECAVGYVCGSGALYARLCVAVGLRVRVCVCARACVCAVEL